MHIKFNRVNYMFTEVTQEFIVYFRKECIEEGYSALYVLRNLKGGIAKFKKSYAEFPELKEMYDQYLERKRSKPSFGYRNLR